MTLVRRSLLKGAAAACALSGVPSFALAQSSSSAARRFEPQAGQWRTFEITTRVDLADAKGAASRVWLPVPSINSDWQRSLESSFQSNGTSRMVSDGTDGARMVYTDGRYNIVPADQALASGVVPRTGSPSMARGFESRVVPLRYVAAAEMEKILKPYARPNAIVGIEPSRNVITIGGSRAELQNYLRTVEIFDVDWLSGMSVGVFPLQSGKASKVVSDLEKVFGEQSKSPVAGMFRFMPLDGANAILVITPQAAYLDDIQHCNPEFLQKFISLCDAQRKIEGVYKGRTKTYDFRGRKVCVVMAGNPYTESGERFRIPDMLANRADIYNLGDIIGDTATDFKASYIENSLSANPVLGRLSTKSQNDLYPILKLAETGDGEGMEFEANHSQEEINEYVSVLKKLIKVRDVILKVNQAYIHSAGQSEDYRTEPAFRLQGSYRDMNKIGARIMPVMNDAELDTLIMSHYVSESQTLTRDAEANLLKFKELIGKLTKEEAARWESIKETFRKNQKFLHTGGDNPMGQVVLGMDSINEGLTGIAKALGERSSKT